MKKILLLAGILLLVGAGCAKPIKQTKNSATQKNPVGKTAVSATEEPKAKKFKIYYPEFIPESLTLDKEKTIANLIIPNKPDKYILYTLGEQTDQNKPYISIRQQPANGLKEVIKNDSTERRFAPIENSKLKNLNGIKYSFKDSSTNKTSKQIIFITGDDTYIIISTQFDDFNFDILEKIAESMK